MYNRRQHGSDVYGNLAGVAVARVVRRNRNLEVTGEVKVGKVFWYTGTDTGDALVGG